MKKKKKTKKTILQFGECLLCACYAVLFVLADFYVVAYLASLHDIPEWF